MPHNKLNISGVAADVLTWVTHDMSHEEHEMLRNVSRLPCLFKHVALMPDAHSARPRAELRTVPNSHRSKLTVTITRFSSIRPNRVFHDVRAAFRTLTERASH